MSRLTFGLWKTIDRYRMGLIVLSTFIGLLFCVIVGLLINQHSFSRQLHHQRLYLVPAQVTQGGVVKTNDIADAIVYGFAYQMFVALNTWSDSADQDYVKAIHTYRYYLTPAYRDQLQADYQLSKQNGNLTDSVQTLAPYQGMGYRPQSVKRLPGQRWIVDLPLRVTRYKGKSVIMDALYDYKIQVVATASSIQVNPWGLALSGILSKTFMKTFE